MKHTPGARAVCTLAAGSVLAATLVTPLSVNAQDTTGGTWLDFGIDQSLSAETNAGFSASSPGTTLNATTDLSAAYRSETRHSQFSATGQITLRGIVRPDEDFEAVYDDPRFRLDYSQTTAANTLNIYGAFTRGDIEFIDPLLDFRDANGNIVITPDFIDLSGEGIRTQLSYGGSLSFRDNRPFGLRVYADVIDISYTDATTPELRDNRQVSYGAEARFDISPVMQATVDLGQTRRETVGLADSINTTLDADLQITRPTGTLGFGTTITQTSAGERIGLRTSGSYAWSEVANISGSIGVTRAANTGDLVSTADLSYNRTLANGAIQAQFSRTVDTNADDNEEVQTSFSLNSTHPLTPLATLGLNAAFARTEETATDFSTEVASVGATLDYTFTREWSVQVGVRFENRDGQERLNDTASSVGGLSRTGGSNTSLSLNVSRDFSFRP